jgi:pyridoxamine 5'-phosphate oxidase
MHEGDEKPIVMKMITDRRSGKVSELMDTRSTGQAEMVWWFGKTSEQYRIQGKTQFVGDSFEDFPLQPSFTHGNLDAAEAFYARARKEQWGCLSDPAREQFFWNVPGIPLEESPTSVPHGGRQADGKVVPVPPEFLLMLLRPHKIDYLRLTDNYRQMDTFENGKWTQTRLNP